MRRKRFAFMCMAVAGVLSVSALKAQATEIIKYVGNPIIVNLNPHITRSVTFPRHISKIVTGIDTNTLSVERSNKTLFLKPLTKRVQGDFYVTEVNGRIIHLILKTTKNKNYKNYEDIKIVSPLDKAKAETEKFNKETSTSFLKRIIKGNLEGVDVEGTTKPVNISISKDLNIRIVRVYEDPIYKAYYGFVYNTTNRVIRIPVEDIYYKGLIGISPEKLYLNPHSKTDIYFVTYK